MLQPSHCTGLACSGCMYRTYLMLAVLHSTVLCVCDLFRGQSVHQLSQNLPCNLSARSSVWLILHSLLQDEVRQLLMRKSSTFARGASKFRGVTKHKVDKLTDIAQRTGTCHCHLLPLVTQNAVEAPQVLSPWCVLCVDWLFGRSLATSKACQTNESIAVVYAQLCVLQSHTYAHFCALCMMDQCWWCVLWGCDVVLWEVICNVQGVCYVSALQIVCDSEHH